MQEYTRESIKQFIMDIDPFFDIVRVVRMDHFTSLDNTETACFDFWGREHPCDNCISRRAVNVCKRMTKFDFVGEDVYYVVATPVAIDGAPASLEILTKMEDDVEINASGYSEFLDKIAHYNNAVTKDALTGIYNKQFFLNRLSSMEFVDEKKQMGIVMCDVDYFKQINDTYGHVMGDNVLSAIGKTLLEATKGHDQMYPVRFGGDEFVILMDDTTHEEQAALIQTVKQMVSHICDQYPGVNVSISAGASCQCQGVSREGLLDAADKELYKDKLLRHSMGADARG